MPDIDVNDVLVSMDIAQQSFDVIRRQETVGANGVAIITTTSIPAQIGAVQPLGDNSLLREEQFTTSNNGVEVWCALRLFGAGRSSALNYQPDLILWDGNYYEVRIVDGWDQFGRGFTHAHCMGYDYVPAQ